MNRRWLTLCISALVTTALLCGCGGSAPAVGGTESGAPVEIGQSSAEAAVPAPPSTEQFSDGDFSDAASETPNASVTLSGASGSISDSTRGSGGKTVTLTGKGVYRITGEGDGVQIVVDDSAKSGNVYLVFDRVSMTNADACLVVENADKVICQLVGENSFRSTRPEVAAIYAEDDLTVNGSGALTLSSGKHGIFCKNDLKLTGGSVNIVSEGIGLKAEDSVRLGGAAVSLSTGHDGIRIDSDEGDGYFYMDAGSLSIQAGYDGIDVGGGSGGYTGYIQLSGGSAEITAGGGSERSKSSTSQKALKCDGSIYVTDGVLTASSADDAIHSDADVSVTGGTLLLSSSDDGVHAAATLSVSGGSLTVGKSYEGLEAETVSVSGGSVSVRASDDGVNAAGGSDSSSAESGPWAQGASGMIRVSGGSLYVNADGDGLDSNGSIYVSGGTLIVEGPSGGKNGALDKGDGMDCVCSVTGGTVLAIGSTDMAVNFDAGTQCSALVRLSGEAGDEITVDDGSGFSFTAGKSFACAVYSSPSLRQGERYTIRAGSNSAAADFSGGLYYSDLSSMGGPPMGGPPMEKKSGPRP